MPSMAYMGTSLGNGHRKIGNGTIHVTPARNGAITATTANERDAKLSREGHHHNNNTSLRSNRRGFAVPRGGGGGGHAPMGSVRIVINISGVRFETFKTTLLNIPDTRLAWLMTQPVDRAVDYYDPAAGEYFFDRHAGVFENILNFYRTGRLHAPQDVCGPLFEEELSFWGIDDKQIEPCCWNSYRAHRDAEEQMAKFAYDNLDLNGSSADEDARNDDENVDDEEKKCSVVVAQQQQSQRLTWWQKFRPKVWKLLDNPSSSRAAQWCNLVSMLIIGISIVTFCLLTLPSIEPNTKVTGRVDPFACLFTGGRCRTATKCGGDVDEDSANITTSPPQRLLLNYSMIAQLGLQQAANIITANNNGNNNSSSNKPASEGNSTSLAQPAAPNASAIIVNVFQATDEVVQLAQQHHNVAESYQFAHHTVTVACSGVWVALNAIDGCCVLLFTLEFIARLVFCPNRRDFFRSYYTYYDILAFVPFYIQRVLTPLLPTSGSISSIILRLLNFSRIFRIFRVFKLARNVTGIKILMQTLKKSSNELLLLVSVLVLAMLIFSSCIYYAQLIELAFLDVTLDEHARSLGDDGSTVITSVPTGLWWAAVTLTTIGYGDKRPTTNTGYFVGFFCAVSSALSLSLPVPIIVNNFAKYYQFVQAQKRLPLKTRRRHRFIVAHEVVAKHQPQQQVSSVENRSGGSPTSIATFGSSSSSSSSHGSKVFSEQQLRHLSRRRRSLMTRSDEGNGGRPEIAVGGSAVFNSAAVNHHVTSTAAKHDLLATSPKHVTFTSGS